MVQRDCASRGFGLAVACMTELEMPDAFGLFDIGRLQMRRLIKAAAGINRYHAHPWQRSSRLVLGWRDLTFGHSAKQRDKLLIGERFIVDSLSLHLLTIKRIVVCLLSPHGTLVDSREQQGITVARL